MIRTSRPLRFLGLVTAGWTAMRIAWLWPQSVVATLAPAVLPPARAAEIGLPDAALVGVPLGVLPFRSPMVRIWPRQSTVGNTPTAPGSISPVIDRGPPRPDPVSIALALAAFVRFTQEEAVGATPQRPTPPPDRLPSRWSGSVWAIARQAGPAVPFAGQLGGSQAGLRVAYLLDRKWRIALVGRAAGALAARDTQLSAGVEWQPLRAPVRLFAEHRIAVDGGKGGPTAGVIAGLDPVALPHGVSLQGYGQAGVIARDGHEGFADGTLHLSHPVARTDNVALEAGLGAWGGAQRHASRLDLGPSVAAILPIGNQRVRLTLDWRQRVAGRARPGSGLALTLGADF